MANILPITIRDYQVELDRLLQLKHPKYFAIPIGRRWGKTYMLVQQLICWMNDEPGLYLWGDTTNTNIDNYYNLYFKPLLEYYSKRYWKFYVQKKNLTLFNSTLHFRSADRPENWEGFGYKKIILNEAGIIMKNQYLYENSVKPMLLDYPDSQLISIGAPKGKTGKEGKDHPFYTICERAKQDLALSESERTYIYYHATTDDNTFLSKDDIETTFEDSDPIAVQQERYALFVTRGGKLAIYCFDHDKHVAPCHYDELQAIILSFDFNKNPATCLISQQGRLPDGREFKHFLDEIYLTDGQATNNGTYIEQVCDIVLTKYGRQGIEAHYIITGDATGGMGRAELPKNMNAWKQVQNKMGAACRYLVPNVNPYVENSLQQCNTIFSRDKKLEVLIDPKCKELIGDLENVKATDDGQIDKKTDSRRSHMLDCLRYDFWNVLDRFKSK